MGGFFGVASKEDCLFDLFFGVDYHSHLGTRRAGMITYGEDGYNRAIHNIENAPFRTKFDKDMRDMKGTNDNENQRRTERPERGSRNLKQEAA